MNFSFDKQHSKLNETNKQLISGNMMKFPVNKKKI